MLKRKKLIIISLLLVSLVLAACGNEKNNEAADSEETGSGKQWSLVQEKDEFGDIVQTDYSRIAIPIEGTFSNTATTDSELTGNVYITSNLMDEYCDYYMVGFSLMEYGETKVSYYSNSEAILKIKVDDEIKEYNLVGQEPNDDFLLGLYDGSFQNISYYPCYRAGTTIADQLYEGKDIKCIIEIDNSKYNFTVESANFAEASKDIDFKIPTKEDTVRSTMGMIREMIGENFVHRVWYNYYKDQYTEKFADMTNEEIEEKIKGDFLRVSSAKEFKDPSGKSSSEQLLSMGAITVDFINYGDGDFSTLAQPYTEENFQEHYMIYGINGTNFPDNITYVKGMGKNRYPYSLNSGMMTVNEMGDYLTFKEVINGIYLTTNSYSGETSFLIKYNGDYTVEAAREYLSQLMDDIK